MNISLVPAESAADTKWSPVLGERTRAFVEKKTSGLGGLSEPTIKVVLAEATDILSHCISPLETTGATAVLVVGYVQSGKTLSFTTVTSLARDNGFGIVIVLAGTTNNLKGQSEDRLAKDLGLEDIQRDWRHFDNPDLNGTALGDIKKTLSNWDRARQGKTVEEKPAVLITVLKHASRLANASALLRQISLIGVPALIIDDESDQAGLNTKARSNLLSGKADESGTYESIVGLRESLPHHSYLQYTATPQANLLLAATDILDPSFAKVISSGIGYTGGKVFFQDRKEDLIVRVPDAEIFDPSAPFAEPPEKLQEALQVFLLGIAAGAGSDGKSNRSMMVQAHSNTNPHALYLKWVKSLLDSWSDAISTENPVVLDEIEFEFQGAYRQLKKTVSDLPDLRDLLRVVAEKASEIRVVVVNSTKDAEKQIKWNTWEYWILIGGQKLDRGFTVEGLTVTYMPRPVSGNADVLQQRARFFGYRSGYIDFCRVYLIQDSIEAFSGYVEDEEFLRDSLRLQEGQPLKRWKRDFILHQRLSRPTRPGVIGRSIKRLPLSFGWTWPKSMHLDSNVVLANESVIDAYRAESVARLQDSTVFPDVVDKRTTAPRNRVLNDVPLSEINDLLLQLRFISREDSLQMTAVEIALSRTLEKDPAALGDVVFMSDLTVSSGPGRNLGVLRSNIHVGMSPSGAKGDQIIYSGDRSVIRDSRFTLQLRKVKLAEGPGEGHSVDRVPWIAMFFPETVANNAWLEDA